MTARSKNATHQTNSRRAKRIRERKAHTPSTFWLVRYFITPSFCSLTRQLCAYVGIACSIDCGAWGSRAQHTQGCERSLLQARARRSAHNALWGALAAVATRPHTIGAAEIWEAHQRSRPGGSMVRRRARTGDLGCRADAGARVDHKVLGALDVLGEPLRARDTQSHMRRAATVCV